MKYSALDSAAAAFEAAVAFTVTFFAFVLTGSLASFLAGPSTLCGWEGHAAPAGSACFRARRFADHVEVLVPLGSPPRQTKLLLRLDAVANGSLPTSVISPRVSLSGSVVCDGGRCMDVALVQNGAGAGNDRVVVEFEYQPSAGTIADALGLDGELKLQPQTDYFLDAAELCVAPRAAAGGGGALTVAEGRLRAAPEELAAAGVASPLVDAGCGEEADLFPPLAAVPSSFLGLSLLSQSYELGGVEDRRRVVELGTECAANVTELRQASSVLQLDCVSVNVPCEHEPSMPFRRVATSLLHLSVAETSAQLWTREDARLLAVRGVATAEEELVRSLVKLVVVVLLAGVTWYRSGRAGTSHRALFAAAAALEQLPRKRGFREGEDAAVALLAAGGRVAAAAAQLTAARTAAGLWVQLAAGCLSLLFFIVRVGIAAGGKTAPVALLGGETAAVDAISAAVVSFSALIGGPFDATARLLISLLVASVGLGKCCFAAATCVLQRSQAARCGNESYAWLLAAATAAWALQAAALGWLLGEMFAFRFAFSAAKSGIGDASLLALLTFLVTVSGTSPAMNMKNN